MGRNTKETILMATLEKFSKYGYAGTNIRDLSASLGIVKSGIYKHFESKEAIWNALLDKMSAYYAERFGSRENMPPVPDTLDALVEMTMQMADITIHDEKIVMTRKLLTIEPHIEQFLYDSVFQRLKSLHCSVSFQCQSPS
jgi:AcrR family transcriptional regulator